MVLRPCRGLVDENNANVLLDMPICFQQEISLILYPRMGGGGTNGSNPAATHYTGEQQEGVLPCTVSAFAVDAAPGVSCFFGQWPGLKKGVSDNDPRAGSERVF
jgi:hypothetical protein